MYTGENIKDLIEFLNSNLEGGAIIYKNIIENWIVKNRNYKRVDIKVSSFSILK